MICSVQHYSFVMLLVETGQLTLNVYFERFNGKFQGECLIEPWFGEVAQAQYLIQRWRVVYSEARPHSALS